CMQLGLLLPPHGLLLMTMKGVSPPQVTMGHIFRAVVPYLFMSLLVLALVFFVPAVAVWLPKALFWPAYSHGTLLHERGRAAQARRGADFPRGRHPRRDQGPAAI